MLEQISFTKISSIKNVLTAAIYLFKNFLVGML